MPTHQVRSDRLNEHIVVEQTVYLAQVRIERSRSRGDDSKQIGGRVPLHKHHVTSVQT